MLAGEIGFAIAIVATLFWPDMTTRGYVLIAVAALIGAAIGVPLGLLVPMTAMPQRIALSHAFGGLAAALVGSPTTTSSTSTSTSSRWPCWGSRSCSGSSSSRAA